MKVALVGIARNEALWVSEWMAYHLQLGFDAVMVYDNGSTDETALKVIRAEREADTRLIVWSRWGSAYQCSAYDDALAKFGSEFDWFAILDLDEFLDCGSHADVKTLIARLGGGGAIALNWAMFGSSGHTEAPSGLMTSSYTRRAPSDFPVNHHVKSLVRADGYLRAVNPHCVATEGSYLDALGDAVQWQHEGLAKIVAGRGVPKVNHYYAKSLAEWRVKMARGYRDAHPARTMADFEACDRNEVEDLSAVATGAAARRRFRFLRDDLRARAPAGRARLRALDFGRTGLTPLVR